MEELTTKDLLTRRALGSYTDQDAVAWATGQLSAQPARANLATLASLAEPLNHFEVEDLLAQALAEVGVSEPAPHEAFVCALRETAESVLSGELSPGDACKRLADAHGGDISSSQLQPFWLLELGRRDLETDGHQFYYPALTLETFDEFVRTEARALLAATSSGSENAC